MKALWMVLYTWLLRLLNVGERRCSYCNKLMGWKCGLRGLTSHGACVPCAAKAQAEVEAYFAQKKQARRLGRLRNRQRPQRSTLRRRTGGWSGVVAMQGLVSTKRSP